MKRLRAIGRCFYWGLIPPTLERWRHGRCHYIDGKKNPTSYKEHCVANLKEAWVLLTFRALDEEQIRFHKL